MAENLLLVISGPSGVGKGTLVKRLLSDLKLAESISCTTRCKREGEVEGKNYFFISHEDFEKKIKKGELLEYSNHFDNFYGTPTSYVLQNLKNNDVVLEIEINGALQIKRTFNEAILILIAPPSITELRKRLKGRNTEGDSEIEMRIGRAEYELTSFKKYDYVVINNNLEEALDDIKTIIKAEKLKSTNQKETMRKILEV
jgi:guanylate kinase